MQHQASTNILQRFVNDGEVVEDEQGQWHVCVQQKAQEASQESKMPGLVTHAQQMGIEEKEPEAD